MGGIVATVREMRHD